MTGLATIQNRLKDNMANHCEDGQLDENIRLYMPEGPVFNLAELTAEENYDVVVGLLDSQANLKKSVLDLTRVLEVSQQEVIKFRTENIGLCKQNERMKENILEAEQCCNELGELHRDLARKDKTLAMLQASFIKLEKEKRTLVEEMDTLSSEMSSMMSARAADQKHISELIQTQRSLQVDLEEYHLKHSQTLELIQKKDFEIDNLSATLRDYSAITQDLKNKIKEQEEEQKEALLYNVSLAEEMGSMGKEEKEEDPDEDGLADRAVHKGNRAVWVRFSLLMMFIMLGTLMMSVSCVGSSQSTCIQELLSAVIIQLMPRHSWVHIEPPPY
ncbi:hypothetical protein UPYG_G00063330 [Umbra pygmaea]|uniref:Uncharacterized protein n=1 Tax=Umbra pygmaea TaxID=75934 RepID=A0ABD0XD52_UMBPY